MTGIINYSPVGKCIYCGSTPKTLTREHIIPRGLKGIHILPKSSCKKCEAITGGIEQMCLRHMFGQFRRRYGFRTKKPKKMPTTLPLRIIGADGKVETRNVPHPDLPGAIGLPIPPPPSILSGRMPNHPLGFRLWTWIQKPSLDEVTRYGGIGVGIGQIHLAVFLRMIAKIAHAHVAATSGLETFRPLLTDYILKNQEPHGLLVGARSEKPPAEDCLHRLTTHIQEFGGTRYVVVDVRLLAQLGAPVYQAVVGTI